MDLLEKINSKLPKTRIYVGSGEDIKIKVGMVYYTTMVRT
jgi:hypothetical protein